MNKVLRAMLSAAMITRTMNQTDSSKYKREKKQESNPEVIKHIVLASRQDQNRKQARRLARFTGSIS